METGGESITSAGPQSQLSPNITVAIISSFFILLLLYPWIIAVSVVCFIIGFTGLEPLDRFIKTSISSGRFGPAAQARYKDYIILTGDSPDSQKNVIKHVTADPLREFMEESEQKMISQQKLETEETQIKAQLSQQLVNLNAGNNTTTGIQNTLNIPVRLSSSNRSSPEKSKPLFEITKRSLSAASSRRVSEDIFGTSAAAQSLVQPFTVAGGVSGIYSQAQRDTSKTPSPSRSSTAASTPSPSIALNPELVGTLRVDQEFRVNIRVDRSFGRLFNNIIDYYISPSWAPYETRRQLKLCLKQLLNSVGEECNRKLLLHPKKNMEGNGWNVNAPVVKLTREKLLPLALHYLDKTLARGVVSVSGEEKDNILSKESKRRIVLKIRKFCRQIFEKFLGKEDRKCKLWMELCVAVLADGVLVNVMNLGRDQLPELLEELVARFKKSCSRRASGAVPVTQPSSPAFKQRTPTSRVKNDKEFVDPLSDDFVEALEEQVGAEPENLREKCFVPSSTENLKLKASENLPQEKVPFLLDSFLDPPFNLEKPDPIVSRWRPTLKDIVSETDLLYPLIQYMKHVGGQQSLVYLQGILDEFPQDGDPHCRRVLELEYLPGFCRSSLFLETMGLSRVEMAMEVGSDPFSMAR